MPHPALAHVAHRPWPPPSGPWVLAMTWEDLLFAHWPLDPSDVRALLPPTLELDTFDGRAWIGVVPFRMARVRVRALPPLPGTATFPELNVRTYVRHGSRDGARPGVWFFSLDAASRLAVRGARRWFHLPYFDAEMQCGNEGAAVVYRSRRTHRGAAPAGFAARYEPSGPVFRSDPGSLEHWLTERYCLYAADPRGRILRGEIHHEPWPLERASASIEEDSMAAASSLRLPEVPPHLLFARRIDVVAWAPRDAAR